MAFRVFISYSTHDLALAAHVKQLLETAQAEVFVAQYTLQPGTELAPEILNAIKSCDLFILLWSENAKASAWVPQEIGAAKASGKPVIPVLLQPGLEVPGFLQGVKYLPLHIEPEKALAWLQQHVASKVQEKLRGQLWLGVAGVVLWVLAQGK
jgi:hypothetical protein